MGKSFWFSVRLNIFIIVVEAKPMPEATEVFDGGGHAVPLLGMKLDLVQ